MIYDVAIIGGGVIGAMTARELMRYNLNVIVLEKQNDVATGASKANSGIIHGGYDPEPGTLKAKLNAEGVELLYTAAKELNVTYKNNEALVCAFGSSQESTIHTLYERGIQNGITATEIISGEEARRLEPNLSKDITLALRVKNSGIICPYHLTIAAMGNAMDNGAELKRNFNAKKMDFDGQVFTILSDSESVSAKYILNCAGCAADKIASLIGDNSFKIIPRAGEYMLLDKTEGGRVSRTIFQVPTNEGKGILVTPTADGNLLIGPTANVVENEYDTATTKEGLDIVGRLSKKSVPGVDLRAVITSFSGVRSSEQNGDFIISPSLKNDKFINVAAIDSPGLTSGVAIAKYAVEQLAKVGLELTENKSFNGARKDTHAFNKMTDSEKNEFIKQNPAYGKIVCRCETVTEGEMLDAIRMNPRATDIDGIKRRTRGGMGRCQGGFCMPFVMKLIARENGTTVENVTKKGGNSYIADGRV